VRPASDFLSDLSSADIFVVSTRSIGSDEKRVGGVRLKDGQVLEADLVVLGTGAAPNTQLLEAAGVSIEEDKTVKVNGALQIEGFDGVYAIGDIATYPNPSGGTGGLLNIEHWNVASNHGRAAAQDIAGGAAKFDKTPIFWSALGAQLRYAGNGKGFDEIHVDGKPEDFDFAAFYAKDGKVIASASMGRDRQSSAPPVPTAFVQIS
jgi:NADPH-dependent 2,4-dienoyl-CoA reductase/sulfur reductase-like enzyme